MSDKSTNFSQKRKPSIFRRPAWGVEVAIGAGVVLVVAAILLLAAVPPVDRDALTHHLAVPKLYLKYGSMVEIPWIEFSYYPMNLDLLYIIPLWIGNDTIPKYIHFLFGILTAALIYSYLRRRLDNSNYGLLGVLMFLTLPVVVKLSITVYVDLGLIFFSTAALLQILQWASSGYQLRHLVLAGIWCGLALGTKYNGLVAFFLLTCMVPIIYLRSAGQTSTGKINFSGEDRFITTPQKTAKALFAAAVFFSSALMVYSPWMIRNVIWTGNPVYPLYQEVFKNIGQNKSTEAAAESASRESDDVQDQGFNHFVARRLIFNESLIETLSIPVRIFFQGEDDNPKYFDGRLNPYLFFFPILLGLGWRRLPSMWRVEYMALASFSILLILYTYVQTDMRIRYVSPIIPPLVILSVLGIHSLMVALRNRWPDVRSAIGMRVVAFGVILFLLPNVAYLFSQFKIVMPLEYLSGKISRDDYIQKFRSEYAAIQFINGNLAEDARLLGLYLGNRRYYCDRHLEFDENLFRKALLSSTSPSQLAKILQGRGFSHVLIRQDIYDGFIYPDLTADQRALFSSWVNTHTVELFSGNNYRLLELMPSQS